MIEALEETLRQAMLAGDVATLDQLIADELVFTSLAGTLVTKAEDLAAHAARILQLTQLNPSERHILRFGDTAVVSVRMAAVGTNAGTPFDTALRYTRIWHRGSDGSWRIVAGHMSVVQE